MLRLLVALMKARSGTAGIAVSVLVVLGVLARHHYDARLSRPARRLADAVILLVLLAAGGLAVVDMHSNVAHPRDWDFPSFYAVADAAAHGLHFYDPAVLTQVTRDLERTQGMPSFWLTEVGYWYLPPSVFLILPLGWLTFRKALLLHYLVQGLMLLGSAWLMRRVLPFGKGVTGLASVLVLLLLFGPVQSTIGYAQIVFGCLFFVLLAETLTERSPVAAGASLAVGFFYKHLLIIPACLMIAGRARRDRVVGLAALAGIVLAMLGSIAALGWAVAGGWLSNGPGARSPQLAIDPVVQSLMALLYRALGATPHGSLGQIVMFPPFVVAAGLLTLATLWLLWRTPEPASTPWQRSCLVMPLTLLCYPNTLISTLALLAPVVLLLYARAMQERWPFAAGAGLVALVFAVCGFAPTQAGWMSLVCWLFGAALFVRAGRAPVT